MRAAILLFLTVLLISPPAVSLAQNDKLIVPGVRIGKWTLAMTIDNLLRMNGPASTEVLYAGGEESLDFRRDSSLYGWESVGVGANTFDKKTIVALVAGVRGAMVPYKTDRGISLLESKRDDVLKVYGKPTVTLKAGSLGKSDLVYDKIGIDFYIWDNGDIRSIWVFRPGNAKSIWKW